MVKLKTEFSGDIHLPSAYQAIGWALAYACTVADKKQDIRDVELPAMRAAFDNNFAIHGPVPEPLPDPPKENEKTPDSRESGA